MFYLSNREKEIKNGKKKYLKAYDSHLNSLLFISIKNIPMGFIHAIFMQAN